MFRHDMEDANGEKQVSKPMCPPSGELYSHDSLFMLLHDKKLIFDWLTDC